MADSRTLDSADQACEVPLVEQLRSVPNDFRASREIQWADDGRATGHQFIPVGFMFHRAADRIEQLERELTEAEAQLKDFGIERP